MQVSNYNPPVSILKLSGTCPSTPWPLTIFLVSFLFSYTLGSYYTLIIPTCNAWENEVQHFSQSYLFALVMALSKLFQLVPACSFKVP